MDSSHIFLFFPIDGMDKNINSYHDGIKFIETIRMLIDRIDCEKGAELYYGSNNKDAFFKELSPMEEFEEIGNFGILDLESALNTILREAGAEDWDESFVTKSKEHCFYGLWNFDELRFEEPQLVLKQIFDKQFLTNEKCLLLNIENAISFNRSFIPVFKDCRNSANQSLPKVIHIHYESNFEGLENWFKKQRQPRAYNYQDYRHIENHPKYIKGKSPLLGGIGGQPQAAILLNDALGCKEIKDLINFDVERKRYIWFEYENTPQNGYHGYHLARPMTHEIDEKAEKRIPEKIKNLLEYREFKNKKI